MTQNDEQNKSPYSEDGTFAETNFMDSYSLDISPYVNNYKLISEIYDELEKIQKDPNCNPQIRASLIDKFLEFAKDRDEFANNLNNLHRRIKNLIIEPNSGFPHSKSLKDNIRGRFQTLIEKYLEDKSISSFNTYMIFDKGHYRPIFPVEIGIYDHMEEIYWGYKVEITRKEENISFISRAVCPAVRDGVLYEVFNKLESNFSSIDFLKLAKNSISILDLWLEDMALIHNEECSDNRSGKLVHYRELRVCKNCLEIFENKDEVNVEEKNIIPYDNLHRQSGSVSTCKEKYYDFLNSCFDLVGDAKLKLFSVMGEFPDEIPIEWKEWWCHKFSVEEINKIKKRIVSLENPHKIIMDEVKQACKKIANKFIQRFSRTDLYQKLLDNSFYPYRDFDKDEYLYKDKDSRIDKSLLYHMDTREKEPSKELRLEEMVAHVESEIPNLSKAKLYFLLRRPETLERDEFIKEHKAKLKNEVTPSQISSENSFQ